MIDCIILPKEPGAYNIIVHGVFSAMPLFWDFDGEKWVGGTDLQVGEAWYIDHVYPLGTGGYYEPPPPPPNDLKARLARYKEQKHASTSAPN